METRHVSPQRPLEFLGGDRTAEFLVENEFASPVFPISHLDAFTCKAQVAEKVVVVRVGDSQSPGADQEGGAGGQAALALHDRRRAHERQERALRSGQRQAAGVRLSQLRVLLQRHLRQISGLHLTRTSWPSTRIRNAVFR